MRVMDHCRPSFFYNCIDIKFIATLYIGYLCFITNRLAISFVLL